MRKAFLSLAILLVMAGGAFAQLRNCGTMDHLNWLQQQDPNLAQRMQAIENATQSYIASNPGETRTVVTIPVVVHVLYNTTAQNISDAQVQAQISQLNADFARTNSDAGSTPSVWSSIAANTEVQFCLAQRDPSGNATNGIIHKSTTKTSFSQNDDAKHNSTGGSDAWPAGSYLNLWVCNLGGGLLGYAQFPGGAAATDGVVVLYSSVGSIASPGTAAPYNKGRTATHEVGHWLNLYHIWGDDGTGCTGSDQCADTPNQADENYGCPTFPTVSCSNTPNGDMFMNYMDYTDDGCMNMFTAGQKARMQALFGTGGT
ncbi:MAG TPA: zinc metalloprotease, partial [Chitinophagales bacterium]|nr:zinc metalloprotease [Chitinophagales bacterium]